MAPRSCGLSSICSEFTLYLMFTYIYEKMGIDTTLLFEQTQTTSVKSAP